MNLLDDPGYFHCEPLRATIKKVFCVQLQDRRASSEAGRTPFTRGGPPDDAGRYHYCKDCEQGKQNRKELEMTEEKKCNKCGPRPIAEFSKNLTNADGLDSSCKKCKNEYQREQREKKKLKENTGLHVAKKLKIKEAPALEVVVSPTVAPSRSPNGKGIAGLLIDVAEKMDQVEREEKAGTLQDALAGAYHAALELAIRLRVAML